MTRSPISLATTFTLGLGLLTLGPASAQTPAKAPAAKAPATKATPAAKTAPAAPPTADEIMQRVEDKKFGDDSQATHSLEIQPKNGQKRLRRYTALRKDFGNVIKLVTFLDAPTDVHGAAFMVWDDKKAADQRWIYLPAIGQVRQLVVADARSSFFGSDFVYEDFTNRDPQLDTHKLVGSQKVDAWECWVVDSTPKSTKGLEFATMRSWVTKGPGVMENLVVRQELKDAQGKVVRESQSKEIKLIDGVPTYMSAIVKNFKTGSESRSVASDIHYNQSIPDQRFDQSQMPRGAPAKTPATVPAKAPVKATAKTPAKK